jgi:hypothetical protein
MNNFIDVCKLSGNYNDKPVYVYISPKNKSAKKFYTSNYYLIPSFVKDPDQLTFMQAVKIINYRMNRMNKNSDDMRPDNLNIKEMIKEIADISIKEK